ncbi:MAG: NAD-dependent epimerase/dehydratase family protein [Patescibacteria group bacterium]
MEKNRCVVLGGTGFIGQHLVHALRAEGYPVTVISRRPATFTKHTDAELLQIALDDTKSLAQTIKPGDFVFDLIASSVPYTSSIDPASEVIDHIYHHIKLFELCATIGVAKLLFASSGGGVYGKQEVIPIPETAPLHPVSPHAIAKATLEHYLAYFYRSGLLNSLIYRVSNPYGPGQKAKTGFGVIPTFIQALHKEDSAPVLVNKGKNVRDFIYIDDLIDAIMVSFSEENKHQVYNLGSATGTSIRDVWQIVQETTGKELTAQTQPARPFDAETVILQMDRFQEEYNWRPKVSIHDGIRRTWEAYRQGRENQNQ